MDETSLGGADFERAADRDAAGFEPYVTLGRTEFAVDRGPAQTRRIDIEHDVRAARNRDVLTRARNVAVPRYRVGPALRRRARAASR